MKKVMNIYGYARITTDETFITTQMNAFKSFQYQQLFVESLLPTDSTSQELNRLLNIVQSGDRILAYDLTVFGKNLAGLSEILADLEERNVELFLLKDQVDINEKQD